MSYEISEHTADLKILVKAESLPELFLESLKAMAEILQPGIKNKLKEKEKIKLESSDITALLIDFLNEVLYLSVSQKRVFDEGIIQIKDKTLQAEIEGMKIENFSKDIKAVTYHQAEIIKKDGIWQTYIVFDI